MNSSSAPCSCSFDVEDRVATAGLIQSPTLFRHVTKPGAFALAESAKAAKHDVRLRIASETALFGSAINCNKMLPVSCSRPIKADCASGACLFCATTGGCGTVAFAWC